MFVEQRESSAGIPNQPWAGVNEPQSMTGGLEMGSPFAEIVAMHVAVLGASPKPDRYANQAVRLLLRHGHTVAPVNPAYPEIEGLQAVPDLEALADGDVDTVTVYMNPGRTRGLAPALVGTGARRVIFNPGTESPELEAELRDAGVEVLEACTLVMLNTGQF
jgi:predicted CoA-binding protein